MAHNKSPCRRLLPDCLSHSHPSPFPSPFLRRRHSSRVLSSHRIISKQAFHWIWWRAVLICPDLCVWRGVIIQSGFAGGGRWHHTHTHTASHLFNHTDVDGKNTSCSSSARLQIRNLCDGHVPAPVTGTSKGCCRRMHMELERRTAIFHVHVLHRWGWLWGSNPRRFTSQQACKQCEARRQRSPFLWLMISLFEHVYINAGGVRWPPPPTSNRNLQTDQNHSLWQSSVRVAKNISELLHFFQ